MCEEYVLTKCGGNADAAVFDKHLQSRLYVCWNMSVHVNVLCRLGICIVFFCLLGVLVAIVCALVCPRIINTLTTYTMYGAHITSLAICFCLF